MAIVASGAFVNVVVHVVVLVIHFRLAVLVTENAFESGKIGLVEVTIRAGIPLVAVLAGVNREIQLIVIPVCRLPCGGAMANFALNRKVCRNVVGIGCVVKIGLMATDTCCRRAGISAGVTTVAIHTGVRTGQRKICVIVIKYCGLPRYRAVANFAFQRKCSSDVVGIRRRLKIIFVTGNAGGWRSGIPGTVAAQTIQPDVRTGQREIGGVMVKRRRFPCGSAVTKRTIETEVILHMPRIGCALKIRLMARIALRWQRGEIAGFVAAFALKRRMCAGKRKLGQIVIEICRNKG